MAKKAVKSKVSEVLKELGFEQSALNLWMHKELHISIMADECTSLTAIVSKIIEIGKVKKTQEFLDVLHNKK
jgi:hypothetical protein